MVTYSDILPDDNNNSIDSFQLRSMLPETIPPDPTGNMALDPEDIFRDEIYQSPQNVKFPGYISEFSEPAVFSDLPVSEAKSKNQLWPTTGCAEQSDSASSDNPTSDTTSPGTSTDSMSHIADAQHKPHTQSPQWSSPRVSSQEHLSLTTGVLSRSSSPIPTPKKSGSSSADSQASSRKAAKRASHNIIEKRYRNNMNAKFTTQEQVITTCRNPQKASKNRPCSMKKCEILINAIKCIQNLEDRNAALTEDVAFLREQHRILGAI